jgi:hypothetical protein
MKRGATFIDAVVGTALMLLVFLGIFGVIRLVVVSVGLGKAKTGAVALANEQIEYLRSLPYNNVAVVGGIPPGTIPPTQTISLNNIDYTRRTFIAFVDAPADGVGPADTNGIQADYKIAKVDVSWAFRNATRTITFLTSIVPKGIETLDGGGTVAINVVNASGVAVPNAEIVITNTVVNPSISIATFANSAGTAYFPGAPTSTAYHIVATKGGYSSAQTYTASTTNPNPNPRDLTVIADTITSATFRIDLLSDVTIRSFDEIRSATWTDPFDDLSLIESSSFITLSGGEARLMFDGTSYVSSGTFLGETLAPDYLNRWKRLLFTRTTPTGTAAKVHVVYDTGSGTALVPDTALPGNSAGFISSPVDLSAVSTTTYPRLALSADLSTSDTAVSPALSQWQLTYDEGPIPRANVPFTIQGAKVIGTDGGGASIYKYQKNITTDADGSLLIPDVEWDTYTINKGSGASALSVAEACPFQPFGVNPGVAQTVSFIFAPASVHSLLVYGTNDAGVPLANANVRVTRAGYDTTITTSPCGQAYFRDLTSGAYTIAISASGFTTQTIPNVTVTGATTRNVLLNP